MSETLDAVSVHDLLIQMILPGYFLKSVKFEAYSFLVRTFCSRQLHDGGNKMLNAGSGHNASRRDGWINLDIRRGKHIDHVCDIRFQRLPFKSESISGIFSEHCAEHLEYYHELPWFLSESFRVLKQGGVIRLIVPDLEKYINAYNDKDWARIKQTRPLDDSCVDRYFGLKYDHQMELINVVFSQFGEHKFGHDYETLSSALESAGFREVQKTSYSTSRKMELCIDQQMRSGESLYVEATK